MRILHILNHTMRGNGHVAVAIDLACEQAAQGHTVAVMAGRSDFAELFSRYGVEYLHVPIDWRNPLKLIRSAVSCAHGIARFRPDIVHSHMAAATALARCVRWRSGYGLVATVHNSFDRQSILMSLADRVVGVSLAVRNIMRDRNVSEAKLAVVHNGAIGSPRRATLAPTPLTLARPAIATVCGLHSRKGVHDLIEAFAALAMRHCAAHLYIVGDGPQREELRAQAEKTVAADRITFLGFRDDPREVLASTDVFVLASHAEPFGLVILEARESGCAIVATDVDGIPEALDNGSAGALVAAQRPDLLANALVRLLDDAQILAAAKRSASNGIELHTVQRMTAAYEDLYSNLIATRTAGVAGRDV